MTKVRNRDPRLLTYGLTVIQYFRGYQFFLTCKCVTMRTILPYYTLFSLPTQQQKRT